MIRNNREIIQSFRTVSIITHSSSDTEAIASSFSETSNLDRPLSLQTDDARHNEMQDRIRSLTADLETLEEGEADNNLEARQPQADSHHQLVF